MLVLRSTLASLNVTSRRVSLSPFADGSLNTAAEQTPNVPTGSGDADAGAGATAHRDWRIDQC